MVDLDGDESLDDSDSGDEASAIYRMAKEQIRSAIERVRAIFTKSDREFLFGEKTYDNEQSERNRWRNIRSRVVNALVDLQLLRLVPSEQREKILSEIEHGWLHEGIAHLIAFVYNGLGKDVEALEQMVESGVLKAELHQPRDDERPVEGVEVEIDLTHGYDVEHIYDKFQQVGGRGLTPSEIGVLVREGKISSDEVGQLAWTEDQRRREIARRSDTPWYHDSEESE